MASKRNEYVVYQASHNGELYYVGHGVKGRESHVNSGCSHVYELNRMHFEGNIFELTLEYHPTKELAAEREKGLIQSRRPQFNVVYCSNSKTDKMRSLSLLLDFIQISVEKARKEGLCNRSFKEKLKDTLDTHGLKKSVIGVRFDLMSRVVYDKTRSRTQTLSRGNATKGKEFIEYIYSITKTSKGGIFHLSDGVINDFIEHLQSFPVGLRNEFEKILEERRENIK